MAAAAGRAGAWPRAAADEARRRTSPAPPHTRRPPVPLGWRARAARGSRRTAIRRHERRSAPPGESRTGGSRPYRGGVLYRSWPAAPDRRWPLEDEDRPVHLG